MYEAGSERKKGRKIRNGRTGDLNTAQLDKCVGTVKDERFHRQRNSCVRIREKRVQARSAGGALIGEGDGGEEMEATCWYPGVTYECCRAQGGEVVMQVVQHPIPELGGEGQWRQRHGGGYYVAALIVFAVI